MKNTEVKITTIIGKGCVIDGDFSAEGSVRLDGTVEGNVKIKGHLVEGTMGKVHGNVEASSTLIGGEVTGSVSAPNKVELTSTARVIGDIKTGMIVIDEKAVFQGKCDMNQEESKAKKRPARESRSGKKTAKEALKEALKEVEEETRAGSETGTAVDAKADKAQAIAAASRRPEESSELG